jgi:cobalamin-dependent methionine synthase I
MTAIQEVLRQRILVLDGAMGTVLQGKALTADDFGGLDYEGCNEHLNLTRPDVIRDIHTAYLEAGADIILTNTFSGTHIVLSEYDLQDQVHAINADGARLARETADLYITPDKPRFVAGSLGPQTKTILGISNVSFGLPSASREVLNSVFLYHCIQAGLDYAIVNSQKLERYASIPENERRLAENLLFWRTNDPIGDFAAFYKDKKPVNKQPLVTLPLEQRLAAYIIEGSKDGLFDDLDQALEQYDKPMDIINGPLMDGMDSVALFVVTCGSGVRDLAETYKTAGEYVRSHAIQAIAVELAEAYAEKMHQDLRAWWGFPDSPEMTMRDRFQTKYRGIRVSFGYPACPDLEDQNKLFALLRPADIGVQLTDGFMMDPEASVSALVLHHPEAVYFNAERS